MNNNHFEKIYKKFYKHLADYISFKNYISQVKFSQANESQTNIKVILYVNSNDTNYIYFFLTLIYLKIDFLLMSTQHHSLDDLRSINNIFNADFIIDNNKYDILKKIISLNHNIIDNKICSIYFLTSGSTGKYKIVHHTLRTLLFSADASNHFYDLKPNDVWAITLPLHHVGGYMIVMRSILAHSKYKIINWKELYLQKNITTINMYSFVPTQIQKLISDKISVNNLKKAKAILVSGAKINSKLYHDLKQLKLNISPSYGSTETASQVAAMTPQEFLNSKNISFKRPLLYRQIQLYDKNNQNNKLNSFKGIVENSIIISGKTICNGYLNDNDETVNNNIFFANLESEDHRIFYSSDIGKYNKNDHSFSILGRRDKIIISAGENISLTKVKDTLEHLVQKECYVIAIDDNFSGEVAIAFIPFSSDTIFNNEIIIKKYLEKTTPKHLIAKHIFIYNDNYQKNNNHQIVKPSLQFLKNLAQEKLKHVVCLLHGFMGDHREFNYLQLKYPNYHLLTPAIPYHYEEFKQDKLQNLWKDLDKYLKIYSKLELYGYSMGGRLLVEYYLKKMPANITKITLESSGIGIQNKQERQDRLSNDLELFDELEKNLKTNFKESYLEKFFIKWYQNPIWARSKELNNVNYQEIIKQRLDSPHLLWVYGIQELSQGIRPNMWNNILKINIPIIYKYGSYDLKYTNIGKNLLQHFTQNNKNNFTIKTYLNSGHNLGILREL